MREYIAAIVFFIVMLIEIFQNSLLFSNQDELNRFFKEAPKAWSAAREMLSQKEIKFNTESYRIRSDGRVPVLFIEGIARHRNSYFRIDGISYRPTRESSPSPFWKIGNPYYTATLARKEIGTESIFMTQALRTRNENFFDKPNGKIPNWHLDRSLYPGFQFQDGCLFDCFVELKDYFQSEKTSSFKVIDAVSERDEQGREIVVLNVVNVYPTDTGWTEAVNRPSVIRLLPEKNWALLEFKQKGRGMMEGHDAEFDFFESTICHYIEDSIFPTKVVQETKLGQNSSITERTYEAYAPSILNYADCRLPAFGLPEPKDLVPKNNIWVVAGILLAVVALIGLLYYLRRAK